MNYTPINSSTPKSHIQKSPIILQISQIKSFRVSSQNTTSTAHIQINCTHVYSSCSVSNTSFTVLSVHHLYCPCPVRIPSLLLMSNSNALTLMCEELSGFHNNLTLANLFNLEGKVTGQIWLQIKDAHTHFPV